MSRESIARQTITAAGGRTAGRVEFLGVFSGYMPQSSQKTTGRYAMQGDSTMIEALNVRLAEELSAISQYT